VAIAAAYLAWAPVAFVSEASLWEPDRLRLPEGGMFAEDAQTYFGTQIELLRNDELAGRAVNHLHELGTNVFDKEGRVIEEKLSVSQVPKSSILVVTVSSPDGGFARAYLTALLNEYLNLRKTESEDTLASISEQVTKLEHELKVEQSALTAFEQTNNLAVLQEEETVAAQYLENLNTQLSDNQLELKLLGTNLLAAPLSGHTFELAGISPDALPNMGQNMTAQQDPELQNADLEIAELNLEREKLSLVYLPKHPKIVKLDAQIERASELSKLFRTKSREQLDENRQSLQARIEGLKNAIHDWQGKITTDNAKIAEADQIKLNVGRIEGVYDRYLALLKSVDINRNITQEGFSILEPPSPAFHSRKQIQLRAAEMVAGGLSFGFGLIIFIAWRDDRFASLADVNETFGALIVGQVPQMPLLPRAETMALLQLDDNRPVYAESYRNLRSAILFMRNSGQRAKIILVTSAMPNEGKSTIAANLARALALGGARTLLIDADLRQGYLHQMLGLNRQPGLADLLVDPAMNGNMVQKNCLPNLSFLARGSHFARPGDLFVGAALGLVFDKFREQYDYIVVDTSPVFAADDAATLAPQADGTLFVVRNRFSRSGMVQKALELLHQRQASVLGVVVNGADITEHSYYFYKDPEYYSQEHEGNLSQSA
jgi:succinoglycan biosynthesis transport protein ExoP